MRACRLPKYMSRSCQHLSAQQLERIRGTPSFSALITHSTPSPRRTEAKQTPLTSLKSLSTSPVRLLSCQSHPGEACALIESQTKGVYEAWKGATNKLGGFIVSAMFVHLSSKVQEAVSSDLRTAGYLVRRDANLKETTRTDYSSYIKPLRNLQGVFYGGTSSCQRTFLFHGKNNHCCWGSVL